MKLITFVGSLRQNSYNMGVAKYIQEHTGENIDLEIINIELPYFDEDLEANKPQVVLDFLAKVETADAFLFVTPEYNHSIPGGLKNAIDWASRGDYLTGKPALIMGASPSAIGAERAQLHLRQILDTKAMKVLPGNAVDINAAHEKIIDGVLIDESTQKFLLSVMENFVAWYELVNK